MTKKERGAVTLSPTEFEDLTQAMRKRRESERRILPVIRVVSGADMLAFCAIYPGERILIGRDASCELQLNDVSVSREHAAVRFNPPETLILEDLNSTNGTTYLDDVVKDEVEIQAGEEIRVGSVALRIERLDMEEIAHLARVVERLREASKDQLTGLLTRRHLDEVLPGQLKRYERAHVPICAVFLDVDHPTNLFYHEKKSAKTRL